MKSSKDKVQRIKFKEGRFFYLLLFTFYLLPFFIYSQTTRTFNVYLRSNFGTDTMWDGNTIRVFGMTNLLSASPRIPAKTLYCNEGDTVILNALSISQDEHHTIHLHGLDADTRNDGDPMTSFWLEHMQDTTYTFVAKHAGTYLYHCHVGDVVHVQMGMYGLIVVKAANEANTAFTGGPAFDRSYNWILSEVDKSWHDTIPVHDPVMDTINLPPYYPDYFLINGKSETQLPGNDSIKISGAQGEFIYLRIGGIGFFTNRIIFPSFLNAKIIDSDGRPLPVEIISDTLDIAPGERYGIMLNPSVQFSENIAVQYINMNTDSIWNTQYVPVNISGFVFKNETIPTSGRFRIYPNPCNGKINLIIDGPDYQDSDILITNTLGEIVFQLKRNASQAVSLDLGEGIYYCSLVSRDGKSIMTKKLAVIK